jgi:hypothetical protein
LKAISATHILSSLIPARESIWPSPSQAPFLFFFFLAPAQFPSGPNGLASPPSVQHPRPNWSSWPTPPSSPSSGQATLLPCITGRAAALLLLRLTSHAPSTPSKSHRLTTSLFPLLSVSLWNLNGCAIEAHQAAGCSPLCPLLSLRGPIKGTENRNSFSMHPKHHIDQLHRRLHSSTLGHHSHCTASIFLQ